MCSEEKQCFLPNSSGRLEEIPKGFLCIISAMLVLVDFSTKLKGMKEKVFYSIILHVDTDDFPLKETKVGQEECSTSLPGTLNRNGDNHFILNVENQHSCGVSGTVTNRPSDIFNGTGMIVILAISENF